MLQWGILDVDRLANNSPPQRCVKKHICAQFFFRKMWMADGDWSIIPTAYRIGGRQMVERIRLGHLVEKISGNSFAVTVDQSVPHEGAASGENPPPPYPFSANRGIPPLNCSWLLLMITIEWQFPSHSCPLVGNQSLVTFSWFYLLERWGECVQTKTNLGKV